MADPFAGGDWLAPFGALGAALTAAGRLPMRLPSIELSPDLLEGRAAASRAGASAEPIRWRPAHEAHLPVERDPAHGTHLLVDRGAAPAGDDVTGLQITWCYLDDDPVETAARLRGPLEERWTAGGVAPLLAAPFHTITPYEWGRWLP
jgi:hypothetical protein